MPAQLGPLRMQEEEDVDFGQTEETDEPAAKRPRKEVGGKRQQRRVTLINSKLASGELQPEEVELAGPLEGWIIHDNKLVPPSKQNQVLQGFPVQIQCRVSNSNNKLQLRGLL